MKTTHRNYSEENGDFHRLVHYFTAGPLPRRTHSTWCLGRLVDWKYALYERKRAYASFCNENAHLWFDAFGELAGFAVSEGGTADFQILTLPGYRLLYPEMLEWVLEAGRERPAQYGCGFSTEVTEFQEWEARALERCGFQREDEFFTRRFDLTGALTPRAALPEGFEMVDLHTCPDYRAQARLRANAFQKKADLSEAEMEERLRFYNRNQNSPIYHAPTDLCVRAADGCFALAGEWMPFTALAAGLLFIPSLALALGVWTGSSKAFEVVYAVFWYLGVLNDVLELDYAGLHASGHWPIYLALSLVLFAFAFWGRKRQLQH